MARMRLTTRALAICVAWMAALCAVPAQGQATFQGLGDLPGGTFHSFANGISPDGTAVVGTSIGGVEPFPSMLPSIR